MLASKNPYNTEIPRLEEMQEMTEEETTKQLQQYLNNYNDCFKRSQQKRYFSAFVQVYLAI